MIRPALHRDLPFLRRSFQETFNAYQQPPCFKRHFGPRAPSRFQVFEEAGEITGCLSSSLINRSRTRRHIEAIWVDSKRDFPEVAGALLDSLSPPAEGGKSLTLEVDRTWGELVELCQTKGFRHYGTVHCYRLNLPPREETLAPSGVRPFHPGDATALFALYNAITPALVRMVEAWGESDFQPGFIERTVASWLRRLGQEGTERFVVCREQVIGYLTVNTQARILQLMVHPGYEALYEELFRFGLGRLGSFSSSPVITWAPDYLGAKMQALEASGFEAVLSSCLYVKDSTLTIKLAPGSLSALDSAPLRPAYCDSPSC